MSDKFHDLEYFTTAHNVLQHGTYKGDRTGTGTQSLAFQQMRFDLSDMSIMGSSGGIVMALTN